MTVASVLYDITKAVFDSLVTCKIERVGRAGPQHSDIETPQWAKETLCLHDPLQGTVHAPVLSIWIWLQTLHTGLWTKKRDRKKQETDYLQAPF